MKALSQRCRSLREDAVNVKSHAAAMEFQQLRWFHRSVIAAGEEGCRDNAVLTAAGIAGTIRGAAVLIQEGELIVGYNYGVDDWYPAEPDAFEEWLAQRTGGEKYDSLAAEFRAARALFSHREPLPISEQGAALAEDGTISDWIICANHTVLGYEQVLALGFEGLLEKVKEFERTNGPSPWYAAVRLLCEAACELGDRYADEAEAMARQETDLQRKEELLQVAATCRRVPRRPAHTFWEAVQSLWFAHIVNTWEDGINANSLGRLDQILYPYYRADLEAGLLTEDEAFELICCLWIKLYRDYDVQQSCVGGCDAEGNDAVNALSWLMLDATEAMDFVRCLSVRLSGQTDPAFLEHSLQVLGKLGNGIPFFFNDDVLIDALTKQGVALEDARDYTQIGCVETVLPGKSNPHAVSARANFLKAMEYALHDGHSVLKPELQPGIATGDPLAFGSFEALFAAVKEQLRHIMRESYLATARYIPGAAINEPKPYKSLLTEGCVESGRDFNGAGATYDYYQMMFMGVPNLADSLEAIRELVFRQNHYTMAELLWNLDNDWPDEAMRLDFVRKAPKFGNDIASVDSLAADLIETGCSYLDKLSAEYGYVFQAQPFTFLWMVEHGEATAATPDGRRDREILAYSVSPMQGRDSKGFTALINSLAALPTRLAAGTTSAIVEVEPQLFTERNIPVFAEILRAGMEKGLCNVQ
ncbi:MAG: pyruvate formate lyase family protein, partial [Oscillospiraceae bacterium]